MTAAWGVSVIIVSYNNADFLGPAIDSALGQDHPLCEVTVVDDCSTDNSREIIAQYGNRIGSILREKNGGTVVAQDSSWPLARYPILIFLDSDDLLFPHAAATVASVWTPETVKVQYPFVHIDKAGRQLGHVSPKFPPNLDTATIRAELLRTGGAPNSGSQCAYSRSLLARIRRDGGFDLENPHEYHMDALLGCNAPFYGEVITLYEPLSCYRLHGGNMFAISSIENANFAMKCHDEERNIDYLARRCEQWGIKFDPAAARRESGWLQECRLFAAKLADEPLSEPIFIILCRAIRASFKIPMPFEYRIIQIAWLTGIATAPRTLATRLLAFRFVPGQRPAWIERLLRTAANSHSWLGWLRPARRRPTAKACRHARSAERQDATQQSARDNAITLKRL